MPTRIMIVDDEPPIRLLIRAYLALDANLTVVAEASTGEEAVALARQHSPEIVLMDFVLPGMSGLKAARIIKKSCPAVRTILLTAYEFDDLRERARENPEMVHASAFLSKREIPRRLLPLIQSLVQEGGPGNVGETSQAG